MKCIASHPYQPHVPLPENGKVVYIRGCASEPSDTPIGDCMDRYSKEGSVIQQCETCDTDNCNIGQIRETNLGLVSTDLIKVRFDSEEMDRLKECIGNAIITRSDPNIRPHFEKTLKGPHRISHRYCCKQWHRRLVAVKRRAHRRFLLANI